MVRLGTCCATKNVFDVIFKLGMGEPVNDDAVTEFLALIELVTQDSSGVRLTNAGTDIFRLKWVLRQDDEVEQLYREALLKHPIVSLMIQVFNGRGAIAREQLLALVIHFELVSKKTTLDDLGPLLATLNAFSIVRYDKRNGSFTVVHEPSTSPSPPQFFVSPVTPYSNINNLRKIIRASEGHLYWIDKHFRKEGFEPLVDAADGQKLTAVTIISGEDNLSASARADYSRAAQELAVRGITLEWRTCTQQAFLTTWHDRWIVANNHTYNIPPVLAIIRGQESEMLKSAGVVDVARYLANSTPIS